jgi:hypothetical protein
MKPTHEKAAPRRGTGRAASSQQRPQIATVWPNGNPAQIRSERDVAKVLAILDELKPGGGSAR